MLLAETLSTSLYTDTFSNYTTTNRIKSEKQLKMTIHDEAWPDTLKDQAAINLLKTYIQLSNASNPTHPDEADEEGFAELFTTDGVYELGSKRAQGHSGKKVYLLLVDPFRTARSDYIKLA